MSRSPPPREAPELLAVGRVRRAHGVRGELLVEPLTDDPGGVFVPGRRLFAAPDAAGAAEARGVLDIEAVTEHRGALILRLHGLDDRGAAERLRNQLLLVPASALRPPRAGEVWLHQLVGLVVEDERLGPVGRVEEFYEMPQGLLLEVRRGEGTVLIPYRDVFVRKVDLEQGRLVMSLPEGLLE